MTILKLDAERGIHRGVTVPFGYTSEAIKRELADRLAAQDVPCAADRHRTSVRHHLKGRWLVVVECLNDRKERIHPVTRGLLIKQDS